MADQQDQRSLWRRWAIVLGIWTILAVVLTGQAYLVIYTLIQASSDLPSPNPQLPLREVFLTQAVECALWACLTMFIFWLGKKFPFGQGSWLRSLAVHIPACLLMALIQSALAALASEFIRHDIPKPSITTNVLIYYFVAKMNNNVFFYWAVLAVSQILNYYRQFRERSLRASQLEAKLAQTQLQVLKMQLHPHFLFNTLNAISALIHQDAELADRMIARLGDLLRATLDNANQQQVPLKQELDFITPYLEIEKARLGKRLTVQLDIDPAAMDAQVPNLILQPLVENAIRHGIAPRAEPGHLAIHASRDNGSLRLAVIDDGPGLSASPSSSGIGLANTRARLEKLYGDQQRLELTSEPGRGLRVGITIPFLDVSAEPKSES